MASHTHMTFACKKQRAHLQVNQNIFTSLSFKKKKKTNPFESETIITVGLWAGVFKKQRTTSDGFTLDIIKYSLTSTTSANIIAGMSSKITIICLSQLLFTRREVL